MNEQGGGMGVEGAVPMKYLLLSVSHKRRLGTNQTQLHCHYYVFNFFKYGN